MTQQFFEHYCNPVESRRLMERRVEFVHSSTLCFLEINREKLKNLKHVESQF